MTVVTHHNNRYKIVDNRYNLVDNRYNLVDNRYCKKKNFQVILASYFKCNYVGARILQCDHKVQTLLVACQLFFCMWGAWIFLCGMPELLLFDNGTA